MSILLINPFSENVLYDEMAPSLSSKKLDLAALTNEDIRAIDFESIPLINPNKLTENDLSTIRAVDLKTLDVKGKSFEEYLAESSRKHSGENPNQFALALSQILSQSQASNSSVRANPVTGVFLKRAARTLREQYHAINSDSPQSRNILNINNLIDKDSNIGQMDFDSLPLLRPDNVYLNFQSLNWEQRQKLRKLDLDQTDRNGVSLRDYLKRSFVAFDNPQAFFNPAILCLIAHTRMSEFVRPRSTELLDKREEAIKQSKFYTGHGSFSLQNSDETHQEWITQQIIHELLKNLERESARTLQILKSDAQEMNDDSPKKTAESGVEMAILGLQNMLSLTPNMDLGVQDLSMNISAQKPLGSPSGNPDANKPNSYNPFAGMDCFGFDLMTAIHGLAFGTGGTDKGIIAIDQEAMNKANNNVEAMLRKIQDLNDAYESLSRAGDGSATMTWHEVSTVAGVLTTLATDMTAAEGASKYYNIKLGTDRETNAALLNSQISVLNSQLNSLQSASSQAYTKSNDHIQMLNQMITQLVELSKTIISNFH